MRRAHAVMLAFEGGLALLALLLGLIFGVAPFASLRFAPSSLFMGTIATIPMLALFAGLWLCRAQFLRRIRERVHQAVMELFARSSVSEIAMVAVAAGIGEEVLFRGFLQAGLEEVVGRWAALVLASLAFGLVHPVTYAYAAIAAALGVYLGLLWIVTGDLLAPIIAHGLYDFIALTAIVKVSSTESGSVNAI